MGDERVSRRELLRSGAALGGGLVAGPSVAAAARIDESSPGAWVLKPDESEIAGKRGTIERSIGSMMSFCTVGQEYHGSTCDGRDVQLLVPDNATQPDVGATYRFEPGDRENSCDETFVRLSAALPCQRATEDDADSSSESAGEADSDSPDGTTVDRSTPDAEDDSTPDSPTESTPTTTESDSDGTSTTDSTTTTTDPGDDATTTTESPSDSTTTTESAADSTPESGGSESDSDTTESESDASESEGESETTTTDSE